MMMVCPTVPLLGNLVANDRTEEEDEDEEMEDEEYIYDDDYPSESFLIHSPHACQASITDSFAFALVDEEPIPVEPRGWDDIDSRLLLLDHHQASHNRRRALTRLDNRGPFQPGSGFVVGSHGGGELFGGKTTR
jgi:E3 ubiquitin-protein ligase HUWE1